MATKEETLKWIEQASAQEKVDPAIFKAFAKNETSYGTVADRKGSQYQGIMQMGEAASKDVGLPLDKRSDPMANIQGAIKLAKKNAATLGIPLTIENAGVLYAAHQQGAGAVKKWLNADPNTPIANIITSKRANANGMAGMTVAQAKAKWIDGTQNVANQWAGNKTIGDSTEIAKASGADTTGAYSQQAIGVAQKLADMNRASMGTFGANDQDKTQGIVSMGAANNTSMNRQADVLGQIQRNWSNYETNPDGSKVVGADGQPVKKGLGKRLFDLTLGSGASAFDNMTQEQIQRDAFKSISQAQTMAKQQQGLNTETVVSPKTYEQAGITAVNQQQADQTGAFQDAQTANAKATLELNKQKLEFDKANLAAQAAGGNGTIPMGEGLTSTDNLVAASKLAGIPLPANVEVKDLGKYIPKDKLEIVKAIAANGGTLGGDPYTAVQTAMQIGTPELLSQAAPHIKFQEAITSSFDKLASTKDLLAKAKVGDKGAGAQYEVAKRNYITQAYQEAATGTSKWSGNPNNPYNSAGSAYQLAGNKTVPALNGVTLEDFSNLEVAMSKAFAGDNSVQSIANVFKTMADARNTSNNFKAFSAPSASAKFEVKVAGADNKIDLASPAGVAQYKALVSAKKADKSGVGSSIWANIMQSPAALAVAAVVASSGVLGQPTKTVTD